MSDERRVHWPKMGEKLWTGDPGPAPAAVKATAGLVALCAVPSAGMAIGSVGLLGTGAMVLSKAVAVFLIIVGAFFAVAFPYSAVAMVRRGRFRAARLMAICLGVMAVIGLAEALLPFQELEGASALRISIIATVLLALGVVLLIGRRSVSIWMDRKRHHLASAADAG